MMEGEEIQESEDFVPELEKEEGECPQAEEIFPTVHMLEGMLPAGYETVQDGDIIEVEGRRARVSIIKLPPKPNPATLFLRGFLKIGVASAIVIAGILLQGSGISDLSSALSYL